MPVINDLLGFVLFVGLVVFACRLAGRVMDFFKAEFKDESYL